VQFVVDGNVREVALRTTVSVNGAESLVAVARLVKELLQTLRSGDVDGEEEQQHLPSPTRASSSYPRQRS